MTSIPEYLKGAYKKGDFVLHSGQKSHFIFDILNIIHKDDFIDNFRNFVEDEKFLVGIEFGGSLLAVLSGKPFAIVRKSGEVYGTIPNGYSIIDDIVTTENSIRFAYSKIDNKNIKNFISIVDRRKIAKLDIKSMLKYY